MNDIALRAFKTFIQSFFGVLIPELCIFLRQDFPIDVSAPAMIFAPMFCASLAAGLSGAWNFLESHFSKTEELPVVEGIDVQCDDFEE